MTNKEITKQKRHFKIRKTVKGTAERPRLSVYKSNKNLYVQLIDDVTSKTIASSSVKTLKLKNVNIESATKVGADIANKAKAAKIDTIVFDRGGNLYHGVVKAVADAARENGLKF